MDPRWFLDVDKKVEGLLQVHCFTAKKTKLILGMLRMATPH
jgi:hypothetical protein